jgi:hypothetical protein
MMYDIRILRQYLSRINVLGQALPVFVYLTPRPSAISGLGCELGTAFGPHRRCDGEGHETDFRASSRHRCE